MPSTNSSQRVYLARQPIYDRRQAVFAYELLYRTAEGTGKQDIGTEESASTLVRAIAEIGLDRLVGDKPAFINIPPELLGDPVLMLLPKERVVLEILETTPPGPEHLDAARELQLQGYKLALDDFVFGAPQTEFIPFCRFVKVDLTLNNPHKLKEVVDFLKKARVRTLAEKVENIQMYAKCQALGFDYYQGYYFARPDLVSSHGIPARRSTLLHVLTRLQDPKITMDQMEQLVSSDVTLTYRLLRLVNSACVGLGDEVSSTRSALMHLGLRRVVALVSLLMMSGASEKSSELMITAMVRAKMCELVAEAARQEATDSYFTAGLLSVLEALFDAPMEQILEQLPLTPELRLALTDPKADSRLARTLQASVAFEEGNWSKLEMVDGGDVDLGASYVNALDWAEQARRSLAA
jgi:c-di-GMP phosphodiesterase